MKMVQIVAACQGRFWQWIWQDRDPVLTWDRGRNDEWDVLVLTGRTCEGDCVRYRSSAATVPGDSMQSGQPCVAGIDVHKKMLAVVVRWEREGQTRYDQRKFG